MQIVHGEHFIRAFLSVRKAKIVILRSDRRICNVMNNKHC